MYGFAYSNFDYLIIFKIFEIRVQIWLTESLLAAYAQIIIYKKVKLKEHLFPGSHWSSIGAVKTPFVHRSILSAITIQAHLKICIRHTHRKELVKFGC